jgi:hypothetical protein
VRFNSELQQLEKLALRQIFDQTAIGNQEVVRGKLLKLDPANVFEDLIFNLALELVDRKELQVYRTAVSIVVPDTGDALADFGGDAELFIEFAGQGFFRTLAGLDLAAGKLPLQGHRLVWAALADQDLIAAQHQCRYDQAQGILPYPRSVG